MRHLTLLLSGLILFQCSFASAGDAALDPKVWHKDLQTAHKKAQEENKPMLVVFGATWCKFCKKLEKETFSNPEMQTFVQDNFIPLYLDLGEQPKVGKILEIKSLPCTVVLSPNADLLGKVVGFKDVDAMQGQLKKTLQTNGVLRQASEAKVVK